MTTAFSRRRFVFGLAGIGATLLDPGTSFAQPKLPLGYHLDLPGQDISVPTTLTFALSDANNMPVVLPNGPYRGTFGLYTTHGHSLLQIAPKAVVVDWATATICVTLPIVTMHRYRASHWQDAHYHLSITDHRRVVSPLLWGAFPVIGSTHVED